MKKEKKPEKRNVRTYKVVDSVYTKADKKAKKEKTTVANLLENHLYYYISR